MSGVGTGDVVVVDAGGSNLGSVRFALERLGVRATVSRDAAAIAEAERIILPGVGAAAPGMARLHELGLVECIRGAKQPLLGVCLGMQLLFERSEEGDIDMLGLLPGEVRALSPQPGIRIPHMGWNALRIDPDARLFHGVPNGAYAYFVHGFAAPAEGAHVTATSSHGGEFAAAVSRGNRYGVQFHPERSGAIGARVLSNFLALPA